MRIAVSSIGLLKEMLCENRSLLYVSNDRLNLKGLNPLAFRIAAVCSHSQSLVSVESVDSEAPE